MSDDASRLRIEELEALLADTEEALEEARGQVGRLQVGLDLCAEARRAAEMQAELSQETAKAATDEMQHFVYAVSHDLRQPLRAVLTNAQMMQRTSELDALSKESCEFIIQGATEMNTRIERMLTFSRTASNLRRSIVPLSAVVQWTNMSMQPLLASSGANIKVNELPVAEVDDSALSALFTELFTNSILYCEDKPARVEVSCEPYEDSHLITVSDNGVGIAPEFHERVFQPFARLHGPEIPGFGLGLAIARKIARAHGGKMWVESDGKSGSRFRFTLPS